MFGYGGYYNKQNGLVTEIYKKCDYNVSDNKHIKSIVNPLIVVVFENPHSVAAAFGATAVNSKGLPLTRGPFNTPVCIDEIRINHYWTKSYEEFMLRLKKGKADGAIPRFNKPFYPNYLSVDNDYAIEKYLPLLKERVKKYNFN